MPCVARSYQPARYHEPELVPMLRVSIVLVIEMR